MISLKEYCFLRTVWFICLQEIFSWKSVFKSEVRLKFEVIRYYLLCACIYPIVSSFQFSRIKFSMHFLAVRCVLHAHPPSFDYRNNIWWRVQNCRQYNNEYCNVEEPTAVIAVECVLQELLVQRFVRRICCNISVANFVRNSYLNLRCAYERVHSINQ